MDGLPDTMVSAAAANVRHRGVDIRVGRVGSPLQQSGRAHDHARLAVAALRRIEFLPRDLDRMAAIRREPLNGCNSFTDGHVRGNAAGPDGLIIDMQRAGAALSDAAAELCARQADVIADDPQQWRLRIGIDVMPHSIYVQIERHTFPPLYRGSISDASLTSMENAEYLRPQSLNRNALKR